MCDLIEGPILAEPIPEFSVLSMLSKFPVASTTRSASEENVEESLPIAGVVPDPLCPASFVCSEDAKVRICLGGHGPEKDDGRPLPIAGVVPDPLCPASFVCSKDAKVRICQDGSAPEKDDGRPLLIEDVMLGPPSVPPCSAFAKRSNAYICSAAGAPAIDIDHSFIIAVVLRRRMDPLPSASPGDI